MTAAGSFGPGDVASALGHMRPEEGWPRQEAATRRALELDPNLAEAHNSLAGLRLYYYRDVPARGLRGPPRSARG